MTFRKRYAGLAAALSMSAGLAQAESLTYAIGYAPGSNPVVAAESLVEYSKANGGPDIQVFPMSLLNIRETPPGIRDHAVDMGFNAHALFLAEYPNSNLPAEFGVFATNATAGDNVFWGPAAMAGAITEYIMLHCPECVEEFATDNQVYLSGQASAAYALHCTQDVTTLAQIRSKQIRTPSGYWSKWVEAMGAVSVFMSANEAFSAMSQGVVDCVVFQPSELITVRLIDVVKSTTLGVPQGLFSGASVANINRDAWRGLDADSRKVLLEASARMNAEMTWLVSAQTTEALEEEAARGIPVHEAAPDLQEATAEFVSGLREDVIAEYTTNYKLADIDAKVETIQSLIDKWVELTRDTETADDLFQLYLTQIYSKVDPETYGL
ncbi:hypothetical protein HYQ43_01505 [Paracoccus pantotrophus]|uniref:TRAP-type C4-dicarboxylate transport system, substrate-binding protein n=1 Tax=Paracoccus pantotrophus TaxID=82367 RepID=A0A7H9BT30_PARPN|nr:hypothetical protein [Paracoccus pantotrophus]QLH13011.1 hypothetical protein HYQ43_01505 [Paracoccus pantotrophus]